MPFNLAEELAQGFAFFGADISNMVFTLSESTTILTWLTIWPSNVPLVTPKAHLA